MNKKIICLLCDFLLLLFSLFVLFQVYQKIVGQLPTAQPKMDYSHYTQIIDSQEKVIKSLYLRIDSLNTALKEVSIQKQILWKDYEKTISALGNYNASALQGYFAKRYDNQSSTGNSPQGSK